MKKFLLFICVIAMSFMVCLPILQTQPVELLKGHVIEKEISLFPVDDVIVRGVFYDYSHWFQVPEFVNIEKAVLTVDLSHAKELISDLSSLRISVNGSPIDSFFLTPLNSKNHRFVFTIASELIEPGFNQIIFSFFMRSTSVPCADLDNPINWAILHKTSNLKLTFTALNKPRVGFFQEIFARPGLLYNNKIAIVMNRNADDNIVNSAVMISAFLGKTFASPRDIRVIFSDELNTNDLQKYNIILLGKPDEFSALEQLEDLFLMKEHFALETTELTESGIFLAKSFAFEERFIFGVISPDTYSVKKLTNYILNEDITTIKENAAFFSDKRLDQVREKKQKPILHRVLFQQLGYPDTTISGVFTRETSFSIKRPCNWKLKQGSNVKLILFISDFLQPDLSGVTIIINGVPATSRKFTGNPNVPIILSVPIPESQLNSRSFIVVVRTYLDIGQKNCNHQYKDKAWVVVKNTSHFNFLYDYNSGEDFSDFPAMIMEKNNVQPTTFVVPNETKAEELSTVLSLAAHIGARTEDIVVPLSVKKSDALDSSAKHQNLIFVGWPKDFSCYKSINSKMPIYYNEISNQFIAKEQLPLLAYEENFALIQMCESPWKNQKKVILFSWKNQGYDYLKNILVNSGLYETIKGDCVFINSPNQASSFYLKMKEKKKVDKKTLYIIWAIALALFVGLLVLVVFLIKKLIRKK